MQGVSLNRRSLFSFVIMCWIIREFPLSRYAPLFSTKPSTEWPNFFTSILEPSVERSFFDAPEAFMTTTEIILQRGYPVEVHTVVTEDGYILELHRIPYGKSNDERARLNRNNSSLGKPVFLQHGMMATDHTWVSNHNNQSLAYLLADRGYDVWLGNSRGTTYSRKHAKLDTQGEEYWNYSWDEMGRYDIPASIDYVLNVTGQSKLAAYYGYSLGCSTFYIAAITQPRMNEKVELMVALGPTVSVANLKNFLRYLAPFANVYQYFLGTKPVCTNEEFLNRIIRLFCETNRMGVAICTHVLFQIFGFSESYDEKGVISVFGHYPAGGSGNTMVQLLQNYNSGEAFNFFDYGSAGNVKHYGTPHAAEYNLSLVTVPVLLVSAESDPFAPPKDVSWLASKLGNVKAFIRVKSSSFTHGDFIWSPRLAELVHLPSIDFLPEPYPQKY